MAHRTQIDTAESCRLWRNKVCCATSRQYKKNRSLLRPNAGVRVTRALLCLLLLDWHSLVGKVVHSVRFASYSHLCNGNSKLALMCGLSRCLQVYGTTAIHPLIFLSSLLEDDFVFCRTARSLSRRLRKVCQFAEHVSNRCAALSRGS
jgi:hypothetical protein